MKTDDAKREAVRVRDRAKYAANKERKRAKARARYHARTPEQKEARRERCRQWRANNQEKVRECARKHAAKNEEALKAYYKRYRKDYYQKNKEDIDAKHKAYKAQNPERHRARAARHRAKNKAKLASAVAKKRRNDPLFSITTCCRSRVGQFLRRRGYAKTSATKKMLGCSWEELMEHLEKRFLPGMTWANRNLWHLDHVIPLATAKSREEAYRLCRYTNLQPLWATLNLAKKARLPSELPEDFYDRIAA